MENRKDIFLGSLFVLLFLITSCATTTLTSVWKDANYQGGTLKKILIIGIAEKPAIKRLFEDEFSRQLKTRGIDAVQSYTVIPADKMSDKEFVQNEVKDMKIDAVLVTRLVDKKPVETYYPPETMYPEPTPPPYHPPVYPPVYHGGWYGYYYDNYRYVTTPGYKVEDQMLILETNLYDAGTDKLIWSALSDTLVQTFEGGIDNSMIKSFIEVIMKKLSEDKIIK
jgi:hypothetical protein